MSANIELYIDVQAQPGRLIGGLSGQAPNPLTAVFQGSHLPLAIFPCKPTGAIAGSASHSLIPLGTFGDIKVAVGTRAGTSTIYAQAGAGTSYAFAQQLSADSDGKSGYWYGELNLNTTALNSALTSAEYVDAWLEIHASVSGVYRVLYQQSVRIYAAVIDPSGAIALPLAASEYFTAAEVNALFVRWNNSGVAANNGKTITLTSPDGGSTREIGITNAKAPTDNVS